MNKKILVSLVSLIALGAGAAYWYVNSHNQNTAGAPKSAPPVPVLLSKAKIQDMPVSLEVVGRAEAYESVTIKARVDGQIAGVTFSEGQHIQQGDEMVRLDSTDFNLRVKQAEATVAKDEAQLAKAKGDTTRYLALFNRNFVSEEKVNEVRSIEAALVATLNADKAAAELARSQFGYTTVRAPFSGVVGAKLVFAGAAVKANDTALATINRVRPLYVTFAIPEKYLARVRVAMAKGSRVCKQGGCLPVSVTLSSDKKQRYLGEMRFIDNLVDAATGTIQMKAVLANPDEMLTPGQYLNVSLHLESLLNVVVVPNEAVQQGTDGPFVFVVNAQGAAEVRAVEVGATDAGVTAIIKGIAPEETVVTDGQLRLAPGVKVVAKSVETAATSLHK